MGRRAIKDSTNATVSTLDVVENGNINRNIEWMKPDDTVGEAKKA